MKPYLFIVGLACLLLLICPALAINSTASAIGVSQYSIQAPENYVIYEIIVDPVPMGTTQNHVLNYNGATFLFSITSAQSYGIFHDFTVSMTYPNGSVSTHSERYTGISSGSYKLDLQPVYYQPQSLNPTFAVYVNVGLSPLKTEFNTMSSDWDPLSSGIDPTSSIPFTAASGNTGAVTNVYCEIMTLDDFKANVVNYNPYFGISNLGAAVFAWTWSMVLSFLRMIPVIGPLAIEFIDMSATVIPELMFWGWWILYNFPAIFMSGETLIGIIAVINAKKPRKGLKAMKKIIDYNVMFFTGIIWVFTTIRDWIGTIIDWISKIVSAMH
jgi:hypothetical protein